MHVPLCVSLHTALVHLRPDRHLSAHVFHDDFRDNEIEQLRRCLDQADRSYDLQVESIDLDRFSTLDSLHGDRMAWGRLLLPQLLPNHGRLIYYDADTMICADLAELYQEDMAGHVLGAVPGASLEWMLESDFYRKKGLNMDAKGFNSGGLLFDVNRWNQEDWTGRVVNFATQHSGECKAADQTALNAVFHEQFHHLPDKFNEIMYPNGNTIESETINSEEVDAVLHFVGSPKPWDLFGSWLHNGYGLFEQYVDALELGGSLLRHKLRWKSMYRTARISRSYWRVLKQKAAK